MKSIIIYSIKNKLNELISNNSIDMIKIICDIFFIFINVYKLLLNNNNIVINNNKI